MYLETENYIEIENRWGTCHKSIFNSERLINTLDLIPVNKSMSDYNRNDGGYLFHQYCILCSPVSFERKFNTAKYLYDTSVVGKTPKLVSKIHTGTVTLKYLGFLDYMIHRQLF